MDCTTKSLRLCFGDATLGITGCGYHVIFNYARGGMESLRAYDREWIYRTPRPTLWRATTDNDNGNRFPFRSGMWLSADMFLPCTGVKIWRDGQAIAMPVAPENNRYTRDEFAASTRLLFTFETITVPSVQIDVAYDVTPQRISVSADYHGVPGLPELPVFGMRFIMPTLAAGFRYEGLSGETYPDRKCGAAHGIFETQGLPVAPYIVPQECGMHMDTEWLEVTRNTALDNSTLALAPASLRFIRTDKPFAFSCLPYTAEELENAGHHEELPPARRTVLCICGAVRGVGGIDSWHADVEPPYHIDAQGELNTSFAIDFSV